MPAGPNMPNHVAALKFGTPASAMVGTSLIAGIRVWLATARACTFPDSICGKAADSVTNAESICPASRSVSMGASPLFCCCDLDVFGQSLGPETGFRDEHNGNSRHQVDRREVLDRVVAEVGVQATADGVSGGCHIELVPIGGRAGNFRSRQRR